MTPFRLFLGDDFQHILERQGLEVQPVGSVIVGRDGLRVAIDHDGLEPVLAQLQRGVHTAVIELDTLADAVRTTAQDHDLAAVGWIRLALLLIGGVEVSRRGREFGRAGVHALVDRHDTQLVPLRADRALRHVDELAQAAVREALALEQPQALGVECAKAFLADARLFLDQILHLREEPRIDVGQLVNALERPAGPEGIRDIQQSVRARCLQLVGHLVARFIRQRQRQLRRQAVEPGLQTAQGFLQRLLERTADRHHLTHRLHLCRQAIVGRRKLLEGEAWDLGHDVVDRRLERRRCRTAGDVVLQFIERVTHGELRRNFGDREARGFRGQRGGAGHARIHLDDEQTPILRTHGELHVGAARVHADLAQHRDGGVAHALILFVRECQGRRDRDGVASVHTHGIEVLDGADNDAVVLVVAHHFHLKLFPTDDRLLDQHLAGRRRFQPARHNRLELFAIIGNTAAGAAHGEGRPDDHRITVFRGNRMRFLDTARDLRFRTLQSDLAHGVAEQLPVLGHVDGGTGGRDELHPMLLEHAFAYQIERGIERCLTPHGRQQGVRLLLLDDPRDGLPVDRLDVDGIRHLRVRHDGRGIGVHQNDAVALLPERLTGLRTGVIELAGLPDNDGAGADDQDALDVSSFGHVRKVFATRAASQARRARSSSKEYAPVTCGRFPLPASVASAADATSGG